MATDPRFNGAGSCRATRTIWTSVLLCYLLLVSRCASLTCECSCILAAIRDLALAAAWQHQVWGRQSELEACIIGLGYAPTRASATAQSRRALSHQAFHGLRASCFAILATSCTIGCRSHPHSSTAPHRSQPHFHTPEASTDRSHKDPLNLLCHPRPCSNRSNQSSRWIDSSTASGHLQGTLHSLEYLHNCCSFCLVSSCHTTR
jgi:hypothetical protein